MGKNKILAGLLSAAVAASLVPVNALAEETDGRSFTNAWGDVIKQNECLYYEDFEGDTGSDFAISQDIQDKGYWHSEVAEVNGNKAMKYFATPKKTVTDDEGNETYIKFDANDGKSLINDREILPASDKINSNGWYEIGYQYYPDTMKGYVRTDYLSVKLAGKSTYILKSHNNNMPDAMSFGNDLVANGYTRDGKPIDIRVIVNTETGEERCYALQNGNTAMAWQWRKFITKTVSYKGVESGSVKVKMGISAAPSIESLGTVDEPSYRVDNFYVRKLEYDTPTVTFVNGDESTEVKADYFKRVTIPERPAKDGYIFIGWYNADGNRVDGTDEKPITKIESVTDDMTITARWVQKSVVTFESNGGTAIEPITTETGEITLPDRPVKEGYSFLGWFYDNDTFEQPFDGKNISESVTVYAKWSEYLIKEDFENYTSGLFDIDSAITAKGYWHNEVVTDETGNKYMKYYITPSEEVTYDQTDASKLIDREILASTEAINKNSWYEIGYTFYPNTMKAYMDNVMSVNMSNNARYTTMKIGSHNSGAKSTLSWDNQHSLVNMWSVTNPIKIKLVVNMSTGAERVYAEFVDQYGKQQYVEKGKTIDNAAANSGSIRIKMNCGEDPEKSSKSVEGVERSFMIDDFYVKELNTATPTVTYVNDGVETTDKANYFNEVKLPTPEKTGFEFVGWFTDNDEQFTGKNITSDITVYAKWSGTYNVTFNANGGKFADESETATVEANSETEVTLPEAPTRDGYTFCGWFTDSACVTEFTGKVYENTTLYARWQTTPEIESVTPQNGSTGNELNPEIVLNFDSEIDDTTLTKANIKVLKDGAELSDSLYNVTSSLNAQRKTVVKITFTTNLEASKEYTVKVLKAVKNQHSTLADDFTSTFTTKSLKLNVEVTGVKNGEENVTDLSAVKGQKIKVSLKLTNGAGVGYATIYSFRNGDALVSAQSPENTVNGETVESELTVPENAESLDLIVLDGLSTLKPLTGKTSIIEK